MLRGITICVLFAGQKHAGTGLLSACNLRGCIYIRSHYQKLLAVKYIYLVSGPLYVVFRLQGGQEAT